MKITTVHSRRTSDKHLSGAFWFQGSTDVVLAGLGFASRFEGLYGQYMGVVLKNSVGSWRYGGRASTLDGSPNYFGT